MTSEWNGATKAATWNDEMRTTRHALADAAKSSDWPRVLQALSSDASLVNATRPGGTSLFAPLHQVAYSGATIEVVQKLIGLGAWRTLQNARGERPLDVAERQGHRHLHAVLLPEYKHVVPLGVLLKIQSHFHAVIRERADRLVKEHQLRLPELEPLLELESAEMWFPVPGMYGGFKYRLKTAGVEAKLVSESWCRVVDGSEEFHVVTSSGAQRVDEDEVD